MIAATTERSAAVRHIADHYLETVNGFVVQLLHAPDQPEATWLSDRFSPTWTARS